MASRLNDNQLRELAATSPIVLANHATSDLPSVLPEIRTGLSAAIEYLYGAGHRSIAYLSGAHPGINAARWDLLLELATERSMSIVEIRCGGATIDAGAESLPRVLASGATAVMAYNDLVAHGVLRACRELKLQVPARFSRIGFDDIFSAELAVPTLTTIRVPLGEVGRTAMSLLVDDASNRTPSLTTLPTQFILRESTGGIPVRQAV